MKLFTIVDKISAMNMTTDTLPNNAETLKIMLLAQQVREGEHLTLLQEWEDKYQALLEQFRLAQQKRFGKSSESYSGQGELFSEDEADIPVEDEDELETITYQRTKKRRTTLPDDLPRERFVIDIPEEDKICDCCGGTLHKMGEETSEKLKFIPAQIKVIEHVRPKYSCRHCEHHEIEVTVKIAPPEPAIIPKSFSTPSLLAQIISAKFQYSLPFYRQETQFRQLGIELSRQTMNRWALKCADAAKPLIELFKIHLLKQSVIHADETTLKVIEDERSKSYIWLYCCGADNADQTSGDQPGIVIFDYQEGSRAGECPVNFLQGYTGYLQVDGYKAYEQTLAKLVGCMAHGRRKFAEAKSAMPKGKTGKAHEALKLFKKLYRIEKALKGKTVAEKYQTRQEKSKPILTAFKTWLDKTVQQVPPKSLLGRAVSYCLKQWEKLIRYIDDGRLNIDNNRAERAVKSYVIGRKNWLLNNTHNGAEASAVLYSLVETAKANGLSPFDYLMYIFEKLPTLDDDADLEHLLPWNVALTQSSSC